MPILESLGAAVKAAISLVPDRVTPFSGVGGYGIGGGNISAFSSPGGFDLGASSGPYAEARKSFALGDNGVVSACSSMISQAFIAAPPILEQSGGKEWRRIEHPLIDLLNNPNQHYGADHLWTRTLSSEIEGGSGYWRVVMNKARTQPVEMWFEREMWPEWSGERFVTRYAKRVDGKPFYLAAASNVAEDGFSRERTDYAVHFKYQLDRNNERFGWTPLNTVREQVFGENMAATWQTALLENGAGISLFVSLKEGVGVGEQIDVAKMDAFVARIKRTRQNAGAGGIVSSSLPVDIKDISWSPDKMGISGIIGYFQISVCSVLDVPLMLVGLPDSGKTYSNLAEADRQFWTRNIAPLQERHGSQIEAQLFPLFGLDRREYRIVWDRSGVEAMQESVNAKHERVRSDYEKGIADLQEATTALGYKSTPEMASVRFGQGGEAAEAPEAEVKRFDPTQSRDESGKWTTGSGGGEGGKGAKASRDLKPGTIEEAAKIGVGIPKGSTNIEIATDASADVLAKYTQTSGKPRTVYHPDWNARQAEAKYGRIADLHADLSAIQSKIDAEITNSGAKSHQALTLRLILKTGLRNGGKEGGGKVEAFGASSLLTSHAKVDGTRVSLDFIGKEGIRQRHVFHDADLAAHIQARQAAGKETLFDGDAGKTLKYLGDLTGDKYKVHDLRTLYGTALAAARVEKITNGEGAPKTEKELKSLKARVGLTVGSHLGNNAKMSLANYIAPQVFEAWEKGVKSEK